MVHTGTYWYILVQVRTGTDVNQTAHWHWKKSWGRAYQQSLKGTLSISSVMLKDMEGSLQCCPAHTPAPQHRNNNVNISSKYQYIPAHSTYQYILVCTGMYWYILVVVCTGIYWYVLVRTGMYMYVHVCNGIY